MVTVVGSLMMPQTRGVHVIRESVGNSPGGVCGGVDDGVDGGDSGMMSWAGPVEMGCARSDPGVGDVTDGVGEW